MDGQIEETPDQVQAPSQPADLAEAMRALRAQGDQVAAADVDGGGAPEAGVGSPEGSVASSQPEGGEGLEEPGLDTAPVEQDGGSGGSPDVPEPAAQAAGLTEVGDGSGFTEQDYQEIQQTIAQSVTQQAARAANEKFKELGIEQVTINHLYQRDDRGRVTFQNPDDPDRPFTSRAEAQQWVDAYNSQVKQQWTQYAREMQQQFVNDTLPAVRLMQFAPVYDSMDAMHQQVFDQLIEPYVIKDSTGMEIGFNCDLMAAKAQADKLCETFGTSANAVSQAPSEQTVPTGPALDMPTSGSSNPQNDPEVPKNLNDAFKLLAKQKKEGRK